MQKLAFSFFKQVGENFPSFKLISQFSLPLHLFPSSWYQYRNEFQTGRRRRMDGWSVKQVAMALLDGRTSEKQDHVDRFDLAPLWDSYPVGNTCCRCKIGRNERERKRETTTMTWSVFRDKHIWVEGLNLSLIYYRCEFSTSFSFSLPLKWDSKLILIYTYARKTFWVLNKIM